MFLKKDFNLQFIDKSLKTIDFKINISDGIFIKKGYKSYLFDRGILNCKDNIILKILQCNHAIFMRDSIASFGDPEADAYAQFIFSNTSNIEAFSKDLKKGFSDFFNDQAFYPLLITNLNLDWVAYETIEDEYGIFAIKKEFDKAFRFCLGDKINEYFFYPKDVLDFPEGFVVERWQKLIIKNYSDGHDE